jgi:hypothetical protein
MKLDILFDEAGNVLGMLHRSSASTGQPSTGEEPNVEFAPGDTEHVATLEIPEELRHLTPSELHASVRVERSGKEPRLAAKTK